MNISQLVILIVVLAVIYYTYQYYQSQYFHHDFAHVHKTRNMEVYTPKSFDALATFMKTNDKQVVIKGAGYSHGGQTLLEDGVQIDMKLLNKVVYDPDTQTVTAYAGCIWYDIITYLARYGRTVAEMQSYYNFSVGGSIAVNCHGRGMHYGCIADTIISMRVMTVDGNIHTCSSSENMELFSGIIGGYGILGIILEATLQTVVNDKVELQVTVASSDESSAILTDIVKDSDNTVFFNGNIYPGRSHEIICYKWRKSSRNLTEDTLYQPMRSMYWGHMILEQIARRTTFLKVARAYLEPAIDSQINKVVYRSYAIAEDANKLKVLSKHPSTTILQEYFVPVDKLQVFLDTFILELAGMNVLNVSLRYVKSCDNVLLNYAPTDMASIVLYMNIWNNELALENLQEWTEKQIDFVISLGGKYYLPYLLVYRPGQVMKMYPGWNEFMKLKERYDPMSRLRNMMFDHISSKK